jgi:hypothetical protein
MRNLGALNADEIRAEEGLSPLPDGKGQDYMTPLNMGTAGATPPTPDAGGQDAPLNG